MAQIAICRKICAFCAIFLVYNLCLCYFSRFFHLCFGQTNKQTDLQTCIPLAFEAIASSSGDIQTLIDKIISQDHTIRQTKSESEESEAFDFDFQNY